MTINAQSLKNKLVEFEKLVADIKPEIISITESWGGKDIGDGIFNLRGYNMYREDRNRRGGGVLLYISDKIEQRVCRPLSTQDFESSTWCWIVEKGGKKILVGSVYRSTAPDPDNDARMLQKIERACEIAGENRILILGDFNVPRIDWQNLELMSEATAREEAMLNLMQDCFLYQHVKEPTRFRNEQESTLDLILTNEEEDVKNIKVLPPLGNSDHGIVMGEFVCEWKGRVERKPRRLYHKGRYGQIVDKMDEINWETEFENKSVQECWDYFKNKLTNLVDEFVPMSTPKEYDEPWMNRALMRYWRKKHFAWKRFTESKSYIRYREYKREANCVKKQTRKAKRNYERKLAKGIVQNKRAFFRYVNSKLTVRPELIEIQNANGELIDRDREICDILGEHFSRVRAPRVEGEMPDMEDMYETEITNIEVKREDVRQRLEKLIVYKSCGSDNLHPFVLQATASATCVPLELIFSKSLEDGECPNDWRSANVTPIFKKGDRTDPSNYRPVSLTSQVCKILEAIVRAHILEHLKVNNILSDKQHGFREGRSCLTNLLDTLECWTKVIDEGDGIDVAYLDFKKAFDLVSHRHLIHKMSKYGIKHQVLEWVESFLNQRTERVVIRGTASKPFEVTSGVPQGSVLGPVLFLIFINDLPLDVISPINLFADDSKVFSRIVSDKNKKLSGTQDGHDILQRDLDNIKEWADKWQMKFNVEKCKVMHLGGSNPRHSYSMDGIELATTSEEKDLGILVDEELKFDRHIRAIVGKANRVLGMIKIGFSCFDKVMFKNLYPVLVRPLLEYCVQVWSPYKRGDINLIEGVQRRATKMVPELRNLPYEERLKRLGLTTLEERRVRGDMIETYKIITGKENVDPGKFFTMAALRGDPDLRHNFKIYKPSFNLNPRMHTFSQRVINWWNELEREVVEALTTSCFKARYDRLMEDRRLAGEENIYFFPEIR